MEKVIKVIEPYVDRIYVVGHPDQAHHVNYPKTVNIVTYNNAEILETVSKCKVILSHNSGAAYVAKMLRIPGIVFHNGDKKRFEWTEYCSDPWSKSPLYREDTYEKIESTLKELLDESLL